MDTQNSYGVRKRAWTVPTLTVNPQRIMTSPTLADQLFSTDSIELAAFFMASGLPKSGESSDGKRLSFLFLKTPKLFELEAAFQNNASIGVRDYNAAMQTLWDVIRQKRRDA